MKYNKGNFFQVEKGRFMKVTQSKLTPSFKYLYFVLLNLEHQLTNDKKDFFFRSIDDLRIDSKLSRQTIMSGLKALKNLKLIHKWVEPVKRKGSNKKTKETITYIRIL